jgi:hypothetical protein
MMSFDLLAGTFLRIRSFPSSFVFFFVFPYLSTMIFIACLFHYTPTRCIYGYLIVRLRVCCATPSVVAIMIYDSCLCPSTMYYALIILYLLPEHFEDKEAEDCWITTLFMRTCLVHAACCTYINWPSYY